MLQAITKESQNSFDCLQNRKSLHHFMNGGNEIPAEQLKLNILGCVKNDSRCQKAIYDFFYEYCFSICHRYSNNTEDSSEIVNDGFIKLFKQIHKFNTEYENVPGVFMGWIKTIMKNTAIDFLRSKKTKTPKSVVTTDSFIVPDESENGFEKICHSEILTKVNKLSPAYKTVFTLYVFENFRHKDISSRLGVSISTSKTNLLKARQELKKMILR